MKLTIFFILLLNFFSFYVCVDGINTCVTSLECLQTACCKDGKCVEQSKCSKDNKICYGLVGAIGIVFLALIFVYFFLQIKESREKFQKELNVDTTTAKTSLNAINK